ncbi:MAG: GNAT family N-acetyltransferase [Myxococcota bacterium]
MMLATDRLVLREFDLPDQEALSSYHSDPRYLQHYASPPDSARLVAAFCAWAEALPRLNYQLAITRVPSRRAIGSVGLRCQGYPATEAEVGIELDPRYWGCGYAVEALASLVRFGANSLDLTRFWALATPQNAAAHRALGRIGFALANEDPNQATFLLESPAA